MSLSGEQVLLRIYLQSADRAPHVPTSERIIHTAQGKARRRHGHSRHPGAGYHGIIKEAVWSIAKHVPVIVEIVDSAEKIAKFVQGPLDQIMVGGMLTLERGGGDDVPRSDARSARFSSTRRCP